MARARAAPLVVLSLFCGASDASPVLGRNGVTHLGPHDTNLLTTGTGMTTKMKMKTKTKLNPMWEEGGHCGFRRVRRNRHILDRLWAGLDERASRYHHDHWRRMRGCQGRGEDRATELRGAVPWPQRHKSPPQRG